MLGLSLVRRWPVGQCCTEATPNSQRFWSSGERDARPRRTVVRSSLLSLLALHAQRTSPSINEDRFSPVCAAQHQRSFCSLRTSFLRCLPACLHTYSARITSRWRAGTTEACSASSEPAEARRLEGMAACQACPAHRVHRCSSGPWSLPNHAACWTCDLAPSILPTTTTVPLSHQPRTSSCPRVTRIRGKCPLLLFRYSKGQALA